MAKLTGTNPDQVPTNADLGTMAYQDKDNVNVGSFTSNGIDDNATSTAMTLDSSGNVRISGDLTGLRYFDIYNTGSTSTDGALVRLITEQVGSTSTTSADIIKRKNGEFRISNFETNAAAYTAFNVGSSERMRIDSSGNLLVGKTSLDFGATAGQEFRADGRVFIGHSGAGHFVNRIGSDGSIAEFRKDGTTVGSIESRNGTHITVQSGGAGTLKSDTTEVARWLSTHGFYPVTNNTFSLGTSALNWKDLYLSGGVYLGGTGAANKLDDYEEGEFAVTLTCGGSGTITLNSGINTLAYTKVGRQVTITGRINISSVSSPSGTVTLNLPFTSAGSLTDEADFALFNIATHDVNIPASAIQLIGEVGASGSALYIRYVASNAQWPVLDASNFDGSGNEYIHISGTYLVA